MKHRKTTLKEIEKRRAEIDAMEPEEPTAADLAAFTEADAENPDDAIRLEELKEQYEYSGNLMLRIPKELHKELAESAKKNGVSLNQYAMYRLAR